MLLALLDGFLRAVRAAKEIKSAQQQQQTMWAFESGTSVGGCAYRWKALLSLSLGCFSTRWELSSWGPISGWASSVPSCKSEHNFVCLCYFCKCETLGDMFQCIFTIYILESLNDNSINDAHLESHFTFIWSYICPDGTAYSFRGNGVHLKELIHR